MEIGRRITFCLSCAVCGTGVPLGCWREVCRWLKGLGAVISAVGDMVPSAPSHSQPHGYSLSPTRDCAVASLSCSIYSPDTFMGSPDTPFIIQWEMPITVLKEMLYGATAGMKWWCCGLSYLWSRSPRTRPVPRSSGPVQAGHSICTWDALGKSMTALCRAQPASGKPRGSSPGNSWLVVSFELSCLPSFTVFHASFSFFFLFLFK